MCSFELYKKVVIIFLTLSSPFLSLAGPGGTGGGDPREGEFIAAADKIAKKLEYIGPQFKEIAPSFQEAVNSTKVICASGETLKKLEDEKQMAYYWKDKKLINLHCDRYESEKNSDGAIINIAHEYFRAINIEGKDYGYSKLVAKGLRNIGLARVEKGSFQGYQALLQKYSLATGIDEGSTLGVVSEFTCTVVAPNNRYTTKNYIFIKKGQGAFQHFINRTSCNIVACTAYEMQNFILDEYLQLKSSSPFIYEDYINKEIDSSQLTFRQAADGSLIGMRTIKETDGIMFWKPLVEKVYSMLSCYRRSLSAE